MHPTRSGLDRAEAKELQLASDRLKADLRRQREAAAKARREAEAAAAAAPTPPPTAPRRAQPDDGGSSESDEQEAAEAEDDYDPDNFESAGEDDAEDSNEGAGALNNQAAAPPPLPGNGGGGGQGEQSGNSPPPPIMSDFEDIDGEDGAKALDKIDSVKVKWDPDDLKFFFLDLIQVKSQWLKRQVLSRALDPLVKAEVKDLLIKKGSEAGGDIYKQLKLRLLELFGPKTEDDYEEAVAMLLMGKSSALAKKLMVKLCDKTPKPLEGCCRYKTITALWKSKLTGPVREAIAGMNLRDNMEAVLKKADDTYATLTAGRGLPARFGKSAYNCKRKDTCPWKSYTKPKNNVNSD